MVAASPPLYTSLHPLPRFLHPRRPYLSLEPQLPLPLPPPLVRKR